MFPLNDDQFEEVKIESVKKESEGWAITRDDGWSFYVPESSPIAPEVGMSARFYGKGMGYVVRGLFLNGVEVFYRDEFEEKEHHLATTYGKDAEEWLARWDEGKSVWSIAMGGFGPGYEQALQMAATEILRHMLSHGYDSWLWEEHEVWEADCKKIEAAMFKNERVEKLGLSGAQFSAATHIAARLYEDGPINMMSNDSVKDRHIQISKHFPSWE